MYITTTTTTTEMPAEEESGIFTNLCASTTIKCISQLLPLLKMKEKYVFLPGDMELDIEGASCPSNKTSN